MAAPKPALRFTVAGTWGCARAAILELPHGPVSTPVFMPVGTQGTIKALTNDQVADIGYRLILGNTYHLGLRPGPEVMKEMGGLHGLMNWKYNLLTDSGGFQMVSLVKLSKVVEEGVHFQSPVDGTHMLLTPEHSMYIQNCLGSDILMALDDVISSTTAEKDRIVEATHRTMRWMDRCISGHKRPEVQNLFGIVQGHLDPELREWSLSEMIARGDSCPGYAIGGLAGGEDKEFFWRVVAQCTARLPADKPRYLMGVGYPLDLVVCSALGVDMFDCVFASRTARFGTALVPAGELRLKQACFERDMSPLQEGCRCYACQNYSRSYFHTLLNNEPSVAAQLLTQHNLTYVFDLMAGLRQAVLDNSLDQFVQEYMETMFPKHDYPSWTVDALHSAGISLN